MVHDPIAPFPFYLFSILEIAELTLRRSKLRQNGIGASFRDFLVFIGGVPSSSIPLPQLTPPIR